MSTDVTGLARVPSAELKFEDTAASRTSSVVSNSGRARRAGAGVKPGSSRARSSRSGLASGSCSPAIKDPLFEAPLVPSEAGNRARVSGGRDTRLAQYNVVVETSERGKRHKTSQTQRDYDMADTFDAPLSVTSQDLPAVSAGKRFIFQPVPETALEAKVTQHSIKS